LNLKLFETSGRRQRQFVESSVRHDNSANCHYIVSDRSSKCLDVEDVKTIVPTKVNNYVITLKTTVSRGRPKADSSSFQYSNHTQLKHNGEWQDHQNAGVFYVV